MAGRKPATEGLMVGVYVDAWGEGGEMTSAVPWTSAPPSSSIVRVLQNRVAVHCGGF